MSKRKFSWKVSQIKKVIQKSRISQVTDKIQASQTGNASSIRGTLGREEVLEEIFYIE